MSKKMDLWWNGIIIVVILIIVGMVFFKYESVDEHEQLRRQKIASTIRWLYQSVNAICYQCNMNPTYTIEETFHITYTDKLRNGQGVINLSIWDPIHQKIFDTNTLIYSVLHEIAHILSPSIHHESPFDEIETRLLNTATELSYYDPNIPIDANYLTLDLTGPFE